MGFPFNLFYFTDLLFSESWNNSKNIINLQVKKYHNKYKKIKE